jgi:hypothetical protein
MKSRQQPRAAASNGSEKKTAASPARIETDASFWNFGAASTNSSSLSESTGANAFGSSSVSPDFMPWAVKQLQAIDRSANVTLLEYCASVEDPGEIREYLAAYLGSTPRVSAFATEFIQRKKKTVGSGQKKSPTSAVSAADADAAGKKNRRRGKKGEQ